MLESIRGLSPFVVYVLLFFVTLFAAYFLIGIGNFFKKLSTVGKGKGGRPSRLGCIATLLLLAVLFALVLMATLLGSYQSFSEQELAAIVQCQRSEEGEADFDLYLTLVRNGVRQDAKIFSMQGNAWALEGEVLQWGSLGRSMGLNSMYRFVSVESRHTQKTNSESKVASRHSLSGEEKSGVWSTLHKLAQGLPFFTIAKYATDYASPNFAKVYEVEGSQSGFFVHEANVKTKASLKSGNRGGRE